MKKIAMIPAGLAACMLLVAFLYMAVISIAFAPEAYPQAPQPFDEMAVELSGYLSGEREGLSEELFTERERLHMVDVLGLFEGGQRITTICLIGAVVLSILSIVLGGLKRFGQGILLGIGVFAVIALCIGLWAVIDFNGWFTVMHELVFTNDLWLLDPAESMLIRMLPLSFFIEAVKTIAVRFGVSALLVALIGLAAMRPVVKRGTNAVSR